MRERLDDHSRFLEEQLAGLEALVKEKGEIDIVVPPIEQDENPRPIRANPAPPSISSPRSAPPVIASSLNATVPKDAPSPLTPSTIGGATASIAVTTDSIPSTSQGTVAGIPLANEKIKLVVSESLPTAVPQTNT